MQGWDRNKFYSYDIETAVTEVVSRLKGEALRAVFIAFQPYWCKKRNKASSGPDWSRLIRKMIWKISSDDVLRQNMYEHLKDRYIADIDSYVIKQDKNKYKTAQNWFFTSKFYGTSTLLPYYFVDLGIDTLYDLCEQYEGLDIIQIANKGTPNEGFARTVNTDNLIRNKIGLKVVNDIRGINLRNQLFDKYAFPKAMAVYIHELLHQFGGDASRQFRTAILAMNYRIMEKAELLEGYEREWREGER